MTKKRINISEFTDVSRLTPEGEQYLLAATSEEKPSRVSDGGAFNVTGRFASTKMGFTRFFESRSLELPYILLCEFSNDVKKYYTQPKKLKVKYLNAKSKIVSTEYTPDLLVIYLDKVVIVECKYEVSLLKEQKKNPNKYMRDSYGKWFHAGAKEAADRMGFIHVVITEKDIDNYLARNAKVMIGELGSLNKTMEMKDSEDIVQYFGNRSAILLSELKITFTQSEIFQALLSGILYFDFKNQLLLHDNKALIYVSEHAFRYAQSTNGVATRLRVADTASILNSKYFFWDETEWRVVNVKKGKDSCVTISNGKDILDFLIKDLAKFIEKHNIYINYSEDNHLDLMLKYPDDAIRIAMYRFDVIKGNINIHKHTTRTVSRWRKNFNDAEAQYGNGLIGLIPKTNQRGNRVRRISDDTINLIEDVISNDYERPFKTTIKNAFQIYVERCGSDISPCSYETFCEAVNARNVFLQTAKREGMKAANQLGPSRSGSGIRSAMPLDGEFAFSVAQLDHTGVEMKFISPIDGTVLNLTLWLTVLLDVYTRYPIGIYFSFKSPSYISSMMVLRDCVKKHSCLPLLILSDQASDFKSIDFDQLLASCGMTKELRPKGVPSFGAQIERFFKTIQDGVITNLPGNTLHNSLGRAASNSHNPKKFACLTPTELAEMFNKWLYDDYINLPHSGTFTTPITLFNESCGYFDNNKPGISDFNNDVFWIKSLPSHKQQLTMSGGSVYFCKIKYHLTCYVHGLSGRNKVKVSVRYNPMDLSKIYVLASNKWIELVTTDQRIRECMESGVPAMHIEIFPRHMRYNQEYYKSLKNKGTIVSSLVLCDNKRVITDFIQSNSNIRRSSFSDRVKFHPDNECDTSLDDASKDYLEGECYVDEDSITTNLETFEMG